MSVIWSIQNAGFKNEKVGWLKVSNSEWCVNVLFFLNECIQVWTLYSSQERIYCPVNIGGSPCERELGERGEDPGSSVFISFYYLWNAVHL